MIVDVAAFSGAWPTYPVNGRIERVVEGLTKTGVDRILISPLDAVWCRNPHLYNGPLLELCEQRTELIPVPIVDPSLSTWQSELNLASEASVQAIRILPNYHGYGLDELDPFWDAVSGMGLVVFVQTRMEDPRRQHPMAVVEDVPSGQVADLADRRRDVRFVIGGPRTGEIKDLSMALQERSNLYADVAQADGLDAVRILVEEGLGEKLLFGSHSPLFMPEAAVARVVTDLDEEEAGLILGENAGKLFSVN